MLHNDKLDKEGKKGKKKAQESPNGDFEKQVLNSFSAIMQKLTEHDEQIAEISQQQHSKGEALLRMVNLCYDPDDTKLPGLTRISLPAVNPFALGMTLNAITSDDVLSGKKTLQEVYYHNYFLLMRSVGGEALNKGIELASEQAAAEAEEQGEAFRAGPE